VATAKVSMSAMEARETGFLSPDDKITFHRSRVIQDAKAQALALATAGWIPPVREEAISVIGAPGGANLMMGVQMFEWGGYASEHDKLIGQKIVHVLSGGMSPSAGKTTAQALLDLEREAFVSLCGEERSVARIQHMLKTKKPLRN
jgi:3-hydroxyacyl-CoA dehydrogenase